MNGMVMLGDNLVRFPSARIAREDVAAVREAAQLLVEAQRIRAETEAAREEARAQGYADGHVAARAELAEVLGELTAAFASANARRTEMVGAAALAALEQLIGAREPDDIVIGLAARALRSAGAGEEIRVVEVATDLFGPVSEYFRTAHPEVKVEANPALGLLGCRVLAGDSHIVADLDSQLAKLRTRWGLSGGSEVAR